VATDEDTAVATDGDTAVATDEDTAVATDEDTAVATDEDTAVATDEDTDVATDEDTAVTTISSVNKQPSTQTAVVYMELLSESDDPANDISANRLERQSRMKRGPYQPKLSLFPRKYRLFV
jgi:hypothetical protein